MDLVCGNSYSPVGALMEDSGYGDNFDIQQEEVGTLWGLKILILYFLIVGLVGTFFRKVCIAGSYLH